MEVSDGSITIPHAEKCGYIEKLTKHGTVLSEVGSKDAAHIIPPYKWIELMRAELNAGASYVIAWLQCQSWKYCSNRSVAFGIDENRFAW